MIRKMSPIRRYCPLELVDSDFNSIFNSANILYIRNTVLTMINHYITLKAKPSLNNEVVEPPNVGHRSRSLTSTDKKNTESMRSIQLTSAKSKLNLQFSNLIRLLIY